MWLKSIAGLLKNKRFWIWQIFGIIIYAVPALIRLATGNVLLPVLSFFATPWVDHYIPGNLVEKILVNAFFPGGAGAIAGEIFYQNYDRSVPTRRQKYLSRLVGAMLWTTIWSVIQFWGNMQNIMGSYGGNLFEYPMVFPLNFLLASLAIFTPDVVFYFYRKSILLKQKVELAINSGRLNNSRDHPAANNKLTTQLPYKYDIPH